MSEPIKHIDIANKIRAVKRTKLKEDETEYKYCDHKRRGKWVEDNNFGKKYVWEDDKFCSRCGEKLAE
jgi:C1A family cysteine protease